MVGQSDQWHTKMKYILYKDGFGFAVYEPNDGSVWHTHKYPEATEASLSDWSDVLAFDFGDYHQIMCAGSVEKLKASAALSNSSSTEKNP